MMVSIFRWTCSGPESNYVVSKSLCCRGAGHEDNFQTSRELNKDREASIAVIGLGDTSRDQHGPTHV